jgi:hypothetical protein|tara:strand:+ start:5143 stop:5316 length:174 start_codon:yes stop_codon:yes gene_type:complete
MSQQVQKALKKFNWMVQGTGKAIIYKKGKNSRQKLLKYAAVAKKMFEAKHGKLKITK